MRVVCWCFFLLKGVWILGCFLNVVMVVFIWLFLFFSDIWWRVWGVLFLVVILLKVGCFLESCLFGFLFGLYKMILSEFVEFLVVFLWFGGCGDGLVLVLCLNLILVLVIEGWCDVLRLKVELGLILCWILVDGEIFSRVGIGLLGLGLELELDLVWYLLERVWVRGLKDEFRFGFKKLL